MKQKKKKCTSLMLLVCVLVLFAGNIETARSGEEKFPSRPIEVIVPFPPGGGTDIVTRLMAEEIGPILGQKVIVSNMPGAGSMLAVQHVAKAKPDGYKIGITTNGYLTVGIWGDIKPKYTLDDFNYISCIRQGGAIFAVLSDFPAKTTKDFFEYARSHPGKLTYGTNGIGGILHFAGEKVFQAMKVKIRMIPTGGAAPTLKAVLGGHIDIYSGTITSILSHIKAGTVRVFFISTAQRSKILPEVPCTSDLGCPSAAQTFWNGVVAPKGVPAYRLAILEKAFEQAKQRQKVKDTLRKRGEEEILISSAKEFEEMVRSEYAANAIAAEKF